jgi:REP element-mobilizing transposase RayT
MIVDNHGYISMRIHQERLYIDEAVYFITAVTHGRQVSFQEPIFADLFVVDLWFATRVKEFRLYGYTVAHAHLHLLIQPCGTSNISDILGSIKRNVSRDINDIMENRHRTRVSGGDDSNRPLQVYDKASIEAMKAAHPTLKVADFERHFQLIRELRTRFDAASSKETRTVKFRWQKSFYDHVIRSDDDLSQHLEYIFGNAVKHKLTTEAEDWRWMWVYGMDEPEEFQ